MALHDKRGRLIYGQLTIIGYNGHLPRGDCGRKRSKFTLKRNLHANETSSGNLYRITSKLSTTTWVVNKYVIDKDTTDIFQLGRSADDPIDFVIVEPAGLRSSKISVSRYACRITVDRLNPKIARIYASGFDSSHNLVLDEKANKWQNKLDIVDALTTNGVLISYPLGSFCDGNNRYSNWYEVSVRGNIYTLRNSRMSIGRLIETENNILKDGTLIHTGDVTLLWRSADGLSLKSFHKNDVKNIVAQLNSGMESKFSNKLIISTKRNATYTDQFRAHFFVACGHVQSYSKLDSMINMCPICQVERKTIKLCMGLESAFYMDLGIPNYAFHPCGHMASEKTVKFWESVPIPHGVNGFISKCPFCAIELDFPGYVKLIFSTA